MKGNILTRVAIFIWKNVTVWAFSQGVGDVWMRNYVETLHYDPITKKCCADDTV